MDLADDTVRALKAAGAEALVFNSPMSGERATDLVDQLARFGVGSVVDLGCGRGALARMTAARIPSATVVGIDTDPQLIAAARHLAVAESSGNRVSFAVADAAAWSGAADAAICIGASHVFGGADGMLAHLGQLPPGGVAIVGDGIWEGSPDAWCTGTFGELPAGPEALAATATAAGWTVVAVSSSTLAEWDEFEHGWTAGVRAVGTEAAAAFAAARAREYDRYRGILGFCWLVLRR